MKIKKIGQIIFLGILITILLSFKANALDDFYEQNKNILESIDFYDMESNVPKEKSEILEKWGFDINNPGEFNTENILEYLKVYLTEQYKSPLKVLIGLVLIISLSGIINLLLSEYVDSEKTEYISSVIAISISIIPFGDIIQTVSNELYLLSGFVISFIPVFIASMILGGEISKGTFLNGIIFAFSQIVSYISTYIFVPFCSGYFALCVSSSLTFIGSAKKITGSLKKAVVISVGIISTVYSTLITVLGSVNSSVDTIGKKAIQFVSANGVPIIGGAVSDAIGMLSGSVSLIKSSVGLYGILVLFAFLIPMIIKIVLWKLVYYFSIILSKVFSLDELSVLFESIEDGLSIILALVFMVGIVFIVSLSLIR